jgi:hypothetical protein
LDAFKAANLSARPEWNHYYFQSIEHLEKQAHATLGQLQQAAAPIVTNPYQVGGALEPARHQATFLDRDDLKDTLSFTIRTAPEMPLFLIQGQRRVGKTSLLKFLPQLLGPGFRVMVLDLQGGEYSDVKSWLVLIRERVNQSFNIDEEPWAATDDWLRSWTELSKHLSTLAENAQIRLVIGFDEYEALQERGFRAQPDKAGQLLGAMRSYTQHQHQVIFLFAGAHFFDELGEPDWGKYFVHSQPLQVRYLSREKTLQLTHPTDDFPIRYENGIPERIYELTRGHPALAQEICYYLVEIANAENRTTLTGEDLDRILRERILVEHNHPLSRFWKNFCGTEVMKATVRQIIRHEKPTNKASLQRLLRHRFVVKTEQGYELSNPLLAQYIQKFDLEFFEV